MDHREDRRKKGLFAGERYSKGRDGVALPNGGGRSGLSESFAHVSPIVSLFLDDALTLSCRCPPGQHTVAESHCNAAQATSAAACALRIHRLPQRARG